MALSGTKAQEATLGQYGSKFTDSATAAVVPPDGYIICAITFMADAVLKADGGLVAENAGTNKKKFMSTQNASHTTGTDEEGTGGIQIANNNIFPKAGNTTPPTFEGKNASGKNFRHRDVQQSILIGEH